MAEVPDDELRVLAERAWELRRLVMELERENRVLRERVDVFERERQAALREWGGELWRSIHR